mmetsp:Transcript_26469/g.78604  ORF Transcript_26469/g.78604 Transcript_26469/m.78604 type:complete len:625 (+) Transcript_26469:373-2247(+)
MHRLHLLKTLELGFAPLLHHALEDRCHDRGVTCQRPQVLRHVALLSPRQQHLGVRHHDRDQVRLEAVAIHIALRHERAAYVDVLNLLRRDVLTLRHLEDVLLPVDDLEPASRDPRAHVAGVQPAVLIQHLTRLHLVLKVALEHVGPTHADFAAREWLVGRQVAHLRYVGQLDLAACKRRPNVARGEVIGARDADARRRLRHSVAFKDDGAKADAQEEHHLIADGRRARRHQLDLATDARADLAEHERVVKRAPPPARRVARRQAPALVRVRALKQRARDRAARADRRHHAVVHAVPQPRHRHKDLRPQHQHVVQQLLYVAAVKANRGAHVCARCDVDALVDVCERQVADVLVARLPVGHHQLDGGRRRDQVVVRDDCAFRHAGGAAGVAQRGHVLGARRDVRTRPPPPKRLHMVQAHNAYGGARGGLWHASARQPIHNEGLDGGAAADGLQQRRQHGCAARNSRQLSVVADVLHSVRAERVIQRYGNHAVRMQRAVDQHPLTAVDRVDSDRRLGRDAQLDEAAADGRAHIAGLCVRHPLVGAQLAALIAFAGAKERHVRVARDARLQIVVQRPDVVVRRLKRGHQLERRRGGPAHGPRIIWRQALRQRDSVTFVRQRRCCGHHA